MDWKNYLTAFTLIGIIILAAAFVFVSGELTNLRSNLSTLQADATALEMDINDMNATLRQLRLKILELESQVKMLESRIPKKNYISIPASAFSPITNTQIYEKGASYLRGFGFFFAAIQLPDGVNITKMSALVVDASNTGHIFVSLYECNMTSGVSGGIAEVGTSAAGAPGQVWLIDDTVYYVIDNKNCVYEVYTYISENSGGLVIRGIILEYEYTS